MRDAGCCLTGRPAAAAPVPLQVPAPNPNYGPLLNLVGLNVSEPSFLPVLQWYNENATSQVGQLAGLQACMLSGGT